MKIYRLGATRPSLPPNAAFPCLILQPDTWNDYGYLTLFHVTGYRAPKRIFLKSSIKILQRDPDRLHAGKTETILPRISDGLDEQFCSVGQDIEYYESLRKAGFDLALKVLEALRDAAYFGKIRRDFEELEGFAESLVRFSDAKKALLEGGEIIRSLPKTQARAFSFSVRMEGAAKPHEVSFDFAGGQAGLRRSVVLIGRNGTGKTAYLGLLAQAVSGRRQVGVLEPELLRFSRTIAVSFSVFDVFERPSKEESDFSYRYVGLRHEAAGRQKKADPLDDPIMTQQELLAKLRQDLAEIRLRKKLAQWREIITTLIDDDIEMDESVPLERLQFYSKLSSGQKFAVSAITGIVANVTEDALILFDEPEHHLHPDIFALFLRAMAALLETFNAYVIYATHAPLLLQQTLARQVRVFRRQGNVPLIGPLRRESFGENLTEITQTVFEAPKAAENLPSLLRKLNANELYVARELFMPPLPLQTAAEFEALEDET